MRDTLSELIASSAEANDKVIVLTGDHGYALFDEVNKRASSQLINVGVAEQLLVSVAAGLAMQGFRPIIYGLASFLPMRAVEQIKIDICQAKLPVVLLGDGAGLVYSTLGFSHQCGEDIGCLRTLPHMRIFSPCDAYELETCFRLAFDEPTPAYIRIGKADRKPAHDKVLLNTLPNLTHQSDNNDIALVATGSMVHIATEQARLHNLSCFSVPQLKPFKGKHLEPLRKYRRLICIEEHFRVGGLCSTLLDAFVENGTRPPEIRSLALDEKFTEECGSHQHALSEHGLSDAQIPARLQALL